MITLFPGHQGTSNPVQLIVHMTDEFFLRGIVSSSNLVEKERYFFMRLFHGASALSTPICEKMQ
jgi:hypothetical protein